MLVARLPSLVARRGRRTHLGDRRFQAGEEIRLRRAPDRSGGLRVRSGDATARSGRPAVEPTDSPAADRTDTTVAGSADGCGCGRAAAWPTVLASGGPGPRPAERPPARTWSAAECPPRPLMAAHLEGQPGSVRITDADLLAVTNVDGGHPAAADVQAVEAAVCRSPPAASVEPDHQVSARDQRVEPTRTSARRSRPTTTPLPRRERARGSLVAERSARVRLVGSSAPTPPVLGAAG